MASSACESSTKACRRRARAFDLSAAVPVDARPRLGAERRRAAASPLPAFVRPKGRFRTQLVARSPPSRRPCVAAQAPSSGDDCVDWGCSRRSISRRTARTRRLRPRGAETRARPRGARARRRRGTRAAAARGGRDQPRATTPIWDPRAAGTGRGRAAARLISVDLARAVAPAGVLLAWSSRTSKYSPRRC